MKPTQIRGLRRRFGWTQVELAARLGTDAVTVSRWERGVSRPRRSAAIRFEALATPLSQQVEGLVHVLGPPAAALLMRRALLLARQPGPPAFPAPPAKRLREVERARREQLALKARARIEP